MENVSLALAAELMMTEEKVLKSFPKNVQYAIIGILEMSDPQNEEEYYDMGELLHEQWERGIAYKDMVRISEETGVDLKGLLELDVQSQLTIAFDYDTDLEKGLSEDDALWNLMANMSTFSQLKVLPDVAAILGMTEHELTEKYSRGSQLRLCSEYIWASSLDNVKEDIKNQFLEILLKKIQEDLPTIVYDYDDEEFEINEEDFI